MRWDRSDGGVRLEVAQGVFPAGPVVLRKDQALSLRLLQQMSPSDNKKGDKVDLELRDEVVVGGRLIARKGARARAVVSDANDRKDDGAPAWLTLRLEDLALADGETLPLKSKLDVSGNAIGVYGWDAVAGVNPLLSMLARGEDVVLPKGTELSGHVTKDTTLDGAKFAEDAAPPVAAQPTDAKTASVAITTSTGDGSVWVAGRYVGEAPLRVEVNRGAHVVKVRGAKGYQVWKKRVVMQGDGLELRVDLVAKASKTPKS